MSEITTAAELDALPEGTTVLDGDHDIMTKGADGQWHLRAENDESAPCHLPAMVLVRPDRPAQPQPSPYPPPGAGPCTCDWTSEDRGGGYFELVADYDPACPQHSVHVWSPRTQMWERTAQPTAQPSVEDVARALADESDDGCFDRIDEWEAQEDWEREAYPGNHPASDYEDAEHWTRLARRLLTGGLIGGRTEAEVKAKALEEAAGASMEWLSFKPDGWGSNPADQSAITAMSWVLDWLHARAAAIRGEQQ